MYHSTLRTILDLLASCLPFGWGMSNGKVRRTAGINVVDTEAEDTDPKRLACTARPLWRTR